MEVELRRLEDLSEAILNDFAYMKEREEQMRDTNGKLLVFCHLICIFILLCHFCTSDQLATIHVYLNKVLALC